MTLTFAATGMTGTTSGNITVSGGLAGTLVMQTQPSSTATAGTAFATQPAVTVSDAYGNLVVNCTYGDGHDKRGQPQQHHHRPDGDHHLRCGDVLRLVLVMNSGSATLTFTANSQTVNSSAITASAGVATKLAVTQQPSTTAMRASLSARSRW